MDNINGVRLDYRELLEISQYKIEFPNWKISQ